MGIYTADLIELTPKRRRTKLAKSELWLLAAVWAQSHADDVGDRDSHTIPFADWPADDPLVELAARYGLTAADIERLFTQMANELETRALRSGYEEAWK